MSWISDLGNFISDIPIIGNIVDAGDKAVYDVLDVVGQGLGLNKANNLFGMDVQQFKDQILHPIGIAAATYGIGSALSAPAAIGEGAAAGAAGAEAAGAGLSAAEAVSAAELGAGVTAGSTTAGTAAGTAAGTGSMLATEGTDLATILADMGATAEANSVIAAGTSAGAGTAGVVDAAGAGAIDAGVAGAESGALNSPSAWYDPATGTAMDPSINPQPWYSGVADKVGSAVGSVIPESTLGKTMLAGALMNVMGNKGAADQTNQNLEAYRNAAAWTPERVNELTAGVQTNVGNVYGKAKKEKQNTIASHLAELGKSGGSAGRLGFQLDEATREAKANEVTNALLKAGVYTPPGQITGGGAYTNQSPWAESAKGASGALGNYSNALMTTAMMKKLYPELAI